MTGETRDHLIELWDRLGFEQRAQLQLFCVHTKYHVHYVIKDILILYLTALLFQW